MRKGTKFVIIGMLSLLVGTAFASPMLITELDPDNIKPYLKPPTEAFTSDVTSEVLYANFSVAPNVENDRRVDLSYFVVLNVTNNSDEPANVSAISFDAQVQDYTIPEDNSGAYSRSESGRTWTAKEAWVDVTGRIEVERPVNWPPHEQPMDAVLIWDGRSLMHEYLFDEHRYEVAVLEIPPRGTPDAFNQIWAPHESRLIAVADARAVQSKYFEPEKLEKVKNEEIVLNTVIQTRVTVNNWTNFALSEDSIKVFVETTDDGYLYSVLPEDTTFTLDEFGVEVFIEPRN